jgi:hypothetical protein
MIPDVSAPRADNLASRLTMNFFHGIKITLWLFSILILPPSAMGHDGWVEVSPAIVEKNQPVAIALIQGNHSNEHKSYRIAGKWDQKYTTLVIFDPKSHPNALSERIIDLGEDAETIGPKGPKGFFLAPFVPKEDGLYHALARQVRTVQQGDGPKLLTVRVAKTAFAAFKVPSVSAAKNLKGFDRPLVNGDGIEIIPVNNPLAVYSGGSITLELRQNGSPVAGQTVALLRRIDGAASAQERSSDSRGQVTFTLGPADSYLARLKFDEDILRPDGQKDKNSFESTYVFPVFNRP